MNFSPALASRTGCVVSSCGRMMVTSAPPRISVWSCQSSKLLAVFPAPELAQVDRVEVSPDSELVLAAGYKAGLVLLFSLTDPEWRGRLECGLAGVVGVTWAGDSRHVITMGDLGVLLTVWSLQTTTVQYVNNPAVWSTSPGVRLYSRDRTYSALVERREGRDLINIFTNHWEPLVSTLLDTEDCAGLAWSPSQDLIAVWDSSLYYRCQVVSLDGRIVWDYSAYQHQLGIKTLCWSPDGKILALASHDNKVRLFCSQFWVLIQEIDHPAALHEGDPVTTRALVYSEESLETGDIDAKIALEMVGGVLVQQSKYQTLQDRPVYLDFSRPDPTKSGGGGGYKVGVGLCEWSSCGRYLASRCDNLPTTVWLWDVTSLRLAALLVQSCPVRSLAWDPALPRLALVTGQSSLHLWTPLGALISRVPQVIRGDMEAVTDLCWTEDGRSLCLSSSKHLLTCRLVKTGQETAETESDLDLEPSREETSS